MAFALALAARNGAILNYQKQAKTNYQKSECVFEEKFFILFLHSKFFKTKSHRQSSMPSNGITKFWTPKKVRGD